MEVVSKMVRGMSDVELESKLWQLRGQILLVARELERRNKKTR